MEKLIKRLSIFFTLIFFVSILAFTCCDNNDRILDNEISLTQDTYQVFFNDRIISTVSIDIDPITSFISTHAVLVRAPPV